LRGNRKEVFALKALSTLPNDDSAALLLADTWRGPRMPARSRARLRLALPKGRNLGPALAAFRAAGYGLEGLEDGERRLRLEFPADGLEVLLLKDWDLPFYVERGIADVGVVGSDVLEEVDADLDAPTRLLAGRSRMSLIGRPQAWPLPGQQVRVASKYVRTAQRVVAEQAWGAEILALAGSVELAPVLRLAELALDIVQTGRTLRENGLVELATVREVTPCVVVHRSPRAGRRRLLDTLIDRLAQAGVAS
jgi:ATP phosphoribosyltransferase